MTKEEYWKKHGGEYNSVLIKKYGFNPFNPKHIFLIGKLHVRNRKRIENALQTK